MAMMIGPVGKTTMGRENNDDDDSGEDDNDSRK